MLSQRWLRISCASSARPISCIFDVRTKSPACSLGAPAATYRLASASTTCTCTAAPPCRLRNSATAAPTASAYDPPRGPGDEPDAADQFFAEDAEELFTNLEAPILLLAPPDEAGGVTGGLGGVGGVGAAGGEVAGLADFASGIVAAADRLVNYATYYQMKARAGTIGGGLGKLLDHTFGGLPAKAGLAPVADITAAKPPQRAFAYMPYMHSESLPIHEQAVKLFDQPGLENNHDFELKHKAIIERFGRYPHRNDILGRPCTVAELVFLEEPGSSF